MTNRQSAGDADVDRQSEQDDPTLEEDRPAIIASVGSSALGHPDVEPASTHVPDNDGEPVTDE